MIVYIEYLSFRTWFRAVRVCIWPGRRKCEKSTLRILFIDASKYGPIWARITCFFLRIACRVEQLRFKLIDLRDNQGRLLSIRVASQDLADIQHLVADSPLFQSFGFWANQDPALYDYVYKSIATVNNVDRETLWRAMLLLHACQEHARAGSLQNRVVVCLGERSWLSVLHSYAQGLGIELVEVPSQWNMRVVLRRFFGARGLMFMQAIRSRIYNTRLSFSRHCRSKESGESGQSSDPYTPRILVEHSGHFNLDQRDRYSDLFFLQESSLEGRDILLSFGFADDPLDHKKAQLLHQYGIKAVARYPQSSQVPSVPVFIHRQTSKSSQYTLTRQERSTREGRWLTEQIENYYALKDYWRELFLSHNAKIFVTWFRYHQVHHAISGAMREIGGVTAIYQRAIQDYPSPAIMVHADVMFGYAAFDAEIERCSGSHISYHITTGYLHDYLFPFLHAQAKQVREQLLRNGVKFIITYFDENSNDDPRWHTGHEFMRVNYEFLLNKLLSDPTLGLVLKPKYPSSLRRRLGHVADLLATALKTGRCYLYEAGPLHGSYPPALGALSADVVIHGHLSSATAGFEAAYMRIPTLLLDREGWPVSPLYTLGVGRVVFTDWEQLWEALTKHRARPGGIPGFGKWGDMLSRLDPFRDGRAAERMGTYLKWIFDGLKAGGDRDTVLADAAKLYTKKWGEDKVTRVSGG